MVEANRYKIPEIGSGRWLRDLAIAIKPISETINATLIKHSTNDARNDSSLYLKAGVRIREFVGTNNNPPKEESSEEPVSLLNLESATMPSRNLAIQAGQEVDGKGSQGLRGQ